MCVRQPNTTEFMKPVIHIGIFERALQHMSSFLNSRKMWQISNNSFAAINPIVGGGGANVPPRFIVCLCKTTRDKELKLSDFKEHSMQTFCDLFWPKIRLVTRSGQMTFPKKSYLRHGYSSRRISMKRTGLLSVFITYKMYLIFFILVT